MHTNRNLAGTLAVLTAAVFSIHSPADAQRAGRDGGPRGGVVRSGGGGPGPGQLRGADLARVRAGGPSAMRRLGRDSGGPGSVRPSSVGSSFQAGNRPTFMPTSSPPGFNRSSRYSSSRRGGRDWDRGDRRHYSRRYDRDWDRKRYRRYDRDYDYDNYYISIGLGGGYPSYSSYYSYPYYSVPYYGYGYSSPYAYYGYPYNPYSGYTYYTGYSSYYGTGGYYW